MRFESEKILFEKKHFCFCFLVEQNETKVKEFLTSVEK